MKEDHAKDRDRGAQKAAVLAEICLCTAHRRADVAKARVGRIGEQRVVNERRNEGCTDADQGKGQQQFAVRVVN